MIMIFVNILNSVILINLFISKYGNLLGASTIQVNRYIRTAVPDSNDDLYDCEQNSECADHEICVRNHCFDACFVEQCPEGEGCGISNHIATCYCLSGFQRNIDGVCEPTCVDDNSCGDQEECRTINNMKKCQCQPHLERHPFDPTECISRGRCTNDVDCDFGKTCKNGLCIDRCSTERNCTKHHEICIATESGSKCACKTGYEYNRKGECQKGQCNVNSDCTKPKTCKLVDYVRTCTCPTGFRPDYRSHGICRWKCLTDRNCTDGHWCRNRMCNECDGIICPIKF